MRVSLIEVGKICGDSAFHLIMLLNVITYKEVVSNEVLGVLYTVSIVKKKRKVILFINSKGFSVQDKTCFIS